MTQAKTAHALIECEYCDDGDKEEPHGICPDCEEPTVFYGEKGYCTKCGEKLIHPLDRAMTPRLYLENNTKYDSRELKKVLHEARDEWLSYDHEEHRPDPDVYKHGIDVTVHPTSGQATTVNHSGPKSYSDKRAHIRLTVRYRRHRGKGGKVTEHSPHPHSAHSIASNFIYGLFRLAGLGYGEPAWEECNTIAADAVGKTSIPFDKEHSSEPDSNTEGLEKQRDRYLHRLEKAQEAVERIEHYKSVLARNRTILQDWREKARYYEREYPDMAEEVRKENDLPTALEIDEED